jgi:hypothetical protein
LFRGWGKDVFPGFTVTRIDPDHGELATIAIADEVFYGVFQRWAVACVIDVAIRDENDAYWCPTWCSISDSLDGFARAGDGPDVRALRCNLSSKSDDELLCGESGACGNDFDGLAVECPEVDIRSLRQLEVDVFSSCQLPSTRGIGGVRAVNEDVDGWLQGCPLT